MIKATAPREFIYLDPSGERLAEQLRRALLQVRVQVIPMNPILSELDSRTATSPIIASVGGSVSFEFAILALSTLKQLRPRLQFVELTVDRTDNPQSTELLEYAIEIHTCLDWANRGFMQWDDHAFQSLLTIQRQNDFHFFVRSFYPRSGKLVRQLASV
jgi:hypothetical protein